MFFNKEELKQQFLEKTGKVTIAVSRSNLGESDATYHLDAWARELIEYARNLGYNVVDINGPALTYEGLTQTLLRTAPDILFNFSHGCRTYLMGNNLMCTLTRGWEDPQTSCGACGKNSNLKSIQGTAIMAFSCHSAAQLGKCCLSYGAPVYVGWSDSLILVSDQYGTQNIFKESIMPLANRILLGSTVGDAVARTREEMLVTVKQFKPVRLVSVPLYYDLKYLTMLGDPNWSLI